MNYNNDKIQSSIIKLESLQKEYDVVLQQYQEAGKNYINALQTEPINVKPCQEFNANSIGISQACYDKIWVDQGCTTTPPNANEEWAKQQTYDTLINDSYAWATMTDDDHRKGCYGDSTEYTTNTSPVNPNDDSSIPPVVYAALNGRSWWGKSGITEGSVDTQEDCEAICASDSKCSGATFNPVKRYCWTRSGEGNIVAGSDDNIALVPKKKAALSTMKALNDKLLSLNKQISNEMSKINPVVEDQTKDIMEKQQNLDSSYQSLLEQNAEMEKQLKEYYAIEEANDNQTLYATQQTTSMRFWILITCLVLFITLNKMYGGDNPSLSITLGLLIIIVLVILTYTLSAPSGFLMWFIVIISVVLMKMKGSDSE
jgi:hypothetical protein